MFKKDKINHLEKLREKNNSEHPKLIRFIKDDIGYCPTCKNSRVEIPKNSELIIIDKTANFIITIFNNEIIYIYKISTSSFKFLK